MMSRVLGGRAIRLVHGEDKIEFVLDPCIHVTVQKKSPICHFSAELYRAAQEMTKSNATCLSGPPDQSVEVGSTAARSPAELAERTRRRTTTTASSIRRYIEEDKCCEGNL
jgi:hypothetical protein